MIRFFLMSKNCLFKNNSNKNYFNKHIEIKRISTIFFLIYKITQSFPEQQDKFPFYSWMSNYLNKESFYLLESEKYFFFIEMSSLFFMLDVLFFGN